MTIAKKEILLSSLENERIELAQRLESISKYVKTPESKEFGTLYSSTCLNQYARMVEHLGFLNIRIKIIEQKMINK